jgi:hypothetical protein
MTICTEHGINVFLQSNIKTLQKPNRLVFVKKATDLSMPRYNSECSMSRGICLEGKVVGEWEFSWYLLLKLFPQNGYSLGWNLIMSYLWIFYLQIWNFSDISKLRGRIWMRLWHIIHVKNINLWWSSSVFKPQIGESKDKLNWMKPCVVKQGPLPQRLVTTPGKSRSRGLVLGISAVSCLPF